MTYELIISFQVVPRRSACIPGALGSARIAIPSDHTNMVEFKSTDDDDFRKEGVISETLKKASRKIGENWEELERAEHPG